MAVKNLVIPALCVIGTLACVKGCNKKTAEQIYIPENSVYYEPVRAPAPQPVYYQTTVVRRRTIRTRTTTRTVYPVAPVYEEVPVREATPIYIYEGR